MGKSEQWLYDKQISYCIQCGKHLGGDEGDLWCCIDCKELFFHLNYGHGYYPVKKLQELQDKNKEWI